MSRTDLSRLERLGVAALSAGAQSWPLTSGPVSTLDAEERRALRVIERGAVVRAGVAGALSALCSVLAAVWVAELQAAELQSSGLAASGLAASGLAASGLAAPGAAWFEAWRYWAWVGGASAVAAVLEIGFLYWDGLRSVRHMARCAGVRLFDGQQLDQFVAVALARAALELPSPKDNALGVDPHREASRLFLLTASVLYKAKIAISSFVLKALLRRALGRVLARSALEFIAVPVTAVWNMIVCRNVLREARLRVMGPSLALTLAEWIRQPVPEEKPPLLVLWALGSVVVKNRHVHPNLLALIAALGVSAHSSQSDLGDCPRFLSALKVAPEPERRSALRALVAAALLDGKLSAMEREWLDVAFTVAGRPAPLEAAQRACAQFVAGGGFESANFSTL